MEPKARKILVVDDNQEIVDIISKILRSKDFNVSIALNGKTAIEKALLEQPEIILLDLKLPDIPGDEILKKIKEIDKDITVIVVTGFGGEQIAVDMMRKGAIDFLSKPIEQETLLTSIKNAIEIRDAQIEDRQFDRYPSLEIFFPFLAHEVRNPLHAISGALSIIQKRCDLKDELLAQSIKIINEETKHLNEFVQECLNFVRPSNHVQFIEVDINEIISVVTNLVSHVFEPESKNIKIVADLDPHLQKVSANYEEIKQVFLNVMKNAFEAMPEGGQLNIKTSCQKGSPQHIEIFFIDNGTGVRRENLSHLFDPFFTTKLRGTGLGLAICRRIIVERHHGKIHIESEEKIGTTVRIELPAAHRLGD